MPEAVHLKIQGTNLINFSSFAPDILIKAASGIGQKEIFLEKIGDERFDNGTKPFKSYHSRSN
jgi:hypothetical protein